MFPQVVGLRLTPGTGGGGADEAAVDRALAPLSPAARAVFALRRLDGLPDPAVRGLLDAAGVSRASVDAALSAVDALDPVVAASEPADPCALRARPDDLPRRRRTGRAVLAGAAVLAVLAATPAFLPGGWGEDGAAAPPYAQNEDAEAALDPGALRRIPDAAWRQSARTDFSVWPTRGDALEDTALLRRALAVWARPGDDVVVTATPGTQTGPPPGPAQLLYAGESGGLSVVLLYDGLRIVRYAEPVGADSGGALLDFARVDGAGAAAASALVVSRGDGNTHYLTAPWVSRAATTDLAAPGSGDTELSVTDSGLTGAVRTYAGQAAETGETRTTGDLCAGFPVLSLTLQGEPDPHLLADLGELVPAQLTYGAPDAPVPAAASAEARERWARTACHLPRVSGSGVRSVNLWDYAGLSLPDGGGEARWACVRAETWRGLGARSLTEFLPPAGQPGEPGTLTAAAEDDTACGARRPAVLSGVLWRSPADSWYLVAAGSDEVTSVRSEGGVTGAADGRTLVVAAEEGAQADISGRLGDDGSIVMLGG
ncbi:hypothetical protein [Streptomyces sp. RFCAC02]|uniref:hypothetical protein n=1 Tax=Streptomyces sp. RFCAC02 TaxID=2499143 RepID=UPI001F10502E|nr:hypothetical protein [Streptomyces sp. RFCAC02]